MRQLAAYTAVARAASFTAAAADLHVSQSSLSRAVADLERQLGVRLLERDTRNVQLTAAGVEALRIAEQIVTAHRAGMKELRRFLLGESGTVAVATLPSVAAVLLPQVISDFRERRPQVTVRLLDGLERLVVDRVLSGDADMAITTIGHPPEQLEHRPLVRDRFVAVLPEGHPLADRDEIAWDDLARQPFLAVGRDSSVPLAGCPLDEKISEMNLVEAGGHTHRRARASSSIDNPMCAATGHRICNDCMKACIYQKQEPVDIPQAETRTLKDVLELPWGFEIYCLLTRWNPLNLRRPLPKPATGKQACWSSGMGPAGFTLAHHLMNDGHTVVGDRRAQDRAARRRRSRASMPRGERVPFRPIRDVAELREPLDARVMAGSAASPNTASPCAGTRTSSSSSACCWSGAASSRCSAACASAARSPSTSAFALGFDHVALCAGAGRPTVARR